ncbi:MAG: glycoside hydrolase family 32 protein [Flavobacteriaceae bacterium]|nr:glycoside hydrolase family 32 protein [Flavobacteriaceae bacterium]
MITSYFIKEINLFSFGILMILGPFCNAQTRASDQELAKDEQYHRPVYHFSPKKNWMNDPNGMFYYDGVYHLYFQHNPFDNVWGPMHWGHATSKDLLVWEEHEIAIYPDSLGTIFSGSAIVDHHNTSGFGDAQKPIVAIYTNHSHEGQDAGRNDYQTQSIAYSTDQGYQFTKYQHNPVIPNPGIIDFRDPKVTWYEYENKWIMSLAVGQLIYFYESKDLKKWTYLSSFGQDIGNHDGVWECPDLIQLPILGTEQSKWVLFVSINPGGPSGGSATQYFVGDFDGQNFTVNDRFAASMNEYHDFWVDYGKDNYAGVTYSNTETDDGKKIFHGWMSNWQYANVVPTTTWRSAMTLPRELSLGIVDGVYRLVSEPISTLSNYSKHYMEIKSDDPVIEIKKNNPPFFTTCEINFKVSAKSGFVATLSSEIGDTLAFGYDVENSSFYIDRSGTGIVDFSDDFGDKKTVCKRISASNMLNGRILLDKASIEVFLDDGLNVMTEIFFIEKPFTTLNFESKDKSPIEKQIQINDLHFN